LGSLFFGAGFFLWLAMESLVLQRMAIPEPLEEHLRPLQGIQIAPPVVGGIAYLSLRDGLPDLFAHMLLGYGLYQFILAVRLVPWTTKTSWSISYWAFSFGIMALTTMTLRFLQANSEELFWQCLGLVMFLVANVVFFLLIYNTITVLKRIHIKGH
jgi:tellurite resistance protein